MYCILFMMDTTEQCGYPVRQQVEFFHHIKNIFMNKQVILVLTKKDILRYDDRIDKKLLKSVIEIVDNAVNTSNITH